MRLAMICLTAALISLSTYGYYSYEHPQNPGESATDRRRDIKQEYIDTARTGQAAPMREYHPETKTCRTANGVWLNQGDVGYESCVAHARAERKIK